MAPWGFREADAYLQRFQFHGFRLGLERMEAILEALDRPHLHYPTIHLAGTNGKGSVASIMASILGEHGLRVGLYTSPHLVSVTERFRIGRETMPPRRFASLVQRVAELVEAGYQLSYFEFTTVLAMLWFAQEGVDLALMETGLGGRLDATNVISPQVAVITPISMDHTAYLGRTLKAIAGEKAAIIKAGSVAVSARQGPGALEVLEERARSVGAPLLLSGREFTAWAPGPWGPVDYRGLGFRAQGLEMGLTGLHQVENYGVALAALEAAAEGGLFSLEDAAVRRGCKEVEWPCRCELFQGRGGGWWLVDGAHNPHGVAAFAAYLRRLQGEMDVRPLGLLWACSNEGGGKEFETMFREVAPLFSRVVITEPPGPRHPVTVEEWREALAGNETGVELVPSWEEGLMRLARLDEEGGLLAVGGSLYLAGAVRARLLAQGMAVPSKAPPPA